MLMTAKEHRYSVGSRSAHICVVPYVNSRPFSPGLGREGEGRVLTQHHPRLPVLLVESLQQDAPISAAPDQVPHGVWGH